MSDARDWPPAESRQSGRLDDAIDGAVRRIVQVDPPTGFRSRVFARLERPPSSSLLFLRLAYAGAALALMVAVTFVMRDTPRTPPHAAETRAIAERTPVASADPATPSTPAEIPPRPPTSAQSRAPRTPDPQPVGPPRDRPISAASLPDDREFVPPPPASVEREAPPIPESGAALPPIPVPAPIEIAPLVIQPLRIEPLPPRK